MYESQSINSIIFKNEHNLTGEFTYRAFISRLKKAFNWEDLVFKYEKYEDIDVDDYTISGAYDMHEHKRYVVINFSNKSNKFILNRHDFLLFRFLLSQTIQHETVHRDQWQKRPAVVDKVSIDFKEKKVTKSEEMEYLSDRDEIDAYAHDIAMEIKYYYPNIPPYAVLKNIFKYKKIISFNYYRKTFRNKKWNDIKNLLFLKTYKWIPYV